MFFEVLGRLLTRASEELRTDVRASVADDFARAKVDAIALFVGEVGAAWSGLFRAVEEENGILERALADARQELDAPDEENGRRGDPLARNAELLADIDDALETLHALPDGHPPLQRLRHGLLEAARVEQSLLEARAQAGMEKVRRV